MQESPTLLDVGLTPIKDSKLYADVVERNTRKS